MARKPSINYWESRGAYYCWHKGEQKLLAKGPNDEPDGPTFRAAKMKFNEIVFGRRPGITLGDLVENYLKRRGPDMAPATREIRKEKLAVICKALGERNPEAMNVLDVSEWRQERQEQLGWSDGNVRLILLSLKACFRWGKKNGLIYNNPIEELELPRPDARGMEYVLSPDQVVKVVEGCARRALREAVVLLRDTGCRPSEVGMAEAKHYKPALRALVYPAAAEKGEKRHKTARRTGKARIIFLGDESLAIVERLVKTHPIGPLFRSSVAKRTGPHAGERWAVSARDLTVAFKALRKKIGVRKLIPYSFRHTYAVRWLEKGGPVDQLAEVLGTSRNMIEKHYGHLAEQTEYLRRLADRFGSGNASSD